jgi:outer membrane beta-barrel protein
MKKTLLFSVLLSLCNGATALTWAADKASDIKDASSSQSDGERLNVDSIKEKYWARGDEAELGVVQNRTYSKKRKLEFSLLGGTLMTDPFLNVKTLGGTIGFHFSEYLSAHIVGWKSYVSGSGAYERFQEVIQEKVGVPAVPATNNPLWYLGGEAVGSLLYGKLSVLGKSIIYFDLHMLGGLGQTVTETGRNFTQHVGIGQKIYLSKTTSLRFDYRAMHFNELLVNKKASADKATPPTLDAPIGNRTNWTHAITLGIDILFGFGKEGLEQ